MTPEDIAKQRHHRGIVELLTDWSLGCNSPKVVSASTSPPEGLKGSRGQHQSMMLRQSSKGSAKRCQQIRSHKTTPAQLHPPEVPNRLEPLPSLPEVAIDWGNLPSMPEVAIDWDNLPSLSDWAEGVPIDWDHLPDLAEGVGIDRDHLPDLAKEVAIDWDHLARLGRWSQSIATSFDKSGRGRLG